MTPDVVRVSWSGGKDSTAAALLHLEAGHKVKMVNYVPMLTEDIPFIHKEQYDFILSAKKRFEDMGAEVYITKGEKTYQEHCLHVNTRGKHIGCVRGFPLAIAGKCDFSKNKIKALESIDVGYYDYADIGIAADEEKRLFRVVDNPKNRSILYEQGKTEADAFAICEAHGLLSPTYKTRRRDGCALCPNSSPAERRRFFDEYPEAIPVILDLQEKIKNNTHPLARAPLRHYQMFIDIEYGIFGDQYKFN